MRARFRGDLLAPAHARTFVTAQLDLIAPEGAPHGDDVVLIVSELVTNSVRAGATKIDVQVDSDAERLEVQVTDDAVGWPTPRASTKDDLDGRGLAIVEELADSWSATAGNPGKTVTAIWYR